MARFAGTALIFVLLTALSMTGGLAWLVACCFRRRLTVFVCTAAGASLLILSASWLSNTSGVSLLPRSSVSVAPDAPLRAGSWIYPALNRDHVTPEMRSVAVDLARHMNTQFPGTITVTLDGSFPVLDGFPLLPHLSHDDGEKLDLALWWQDETGRYVPGVSPSPIGYWGYAEGASDCPVRQADLRWDLPWLQAVLPRMKLDAARTRAALLWLAADPRVSKVLIEPHILARLDISHPKLRFQGCRAARHDDHIHFQL